MDQKPGAVRFNRSNTAELLPQSGAVSSTREETRGDEEIKENERRDGEVDEVEDETHFVSYQLSAFSFQLSAFRVQLSAFSFRLSEFSLGDDFRLIAES